MYRVLLCESSGDPRAYAAGNYGLLQINGIHSHLVGGDPSALYDPETNIRIAHDLWLSRGYRPWPVCGTR